VLEDKDRKRRNTQPADRSSSSSNPPLPTKTGASIADAIIISAKTQASMPDPLTSMEKTKQEQAIDVELMFYF
jgi:hypothetical protein